VTGKSSGQIPEFISEQGYGVIAGVFQAAELSDVAAQLGDESIKRGRAGARHVLSCSAVRAVATDARLLEIARSILGADALPFRATYFDKSPHSNWLVAWHQDTALPLTAKTGTPGWGPWSMKDGVPYAHAPAEALEQVLALRVHLDDSTATNGPLKVIPDSHRLGVLSDDEIQKRAHESAAIECTVLTGGVIAMCPLAIHASSKSESELPRRVLHIEYATHIDIAKDVRLAVV
jgi:ectoine hydroxylase-related dioxygenase (phytanoyl-CoA dioxygenase family)